MSQDQHFPIESIRADFFDALDQQNDGEGLVVVVAPTGSGKSTQLPVWLESWADTQPTQGAILVVEPRRVACRALASFVASQRSEEAGQSVGYRIRFESATSASTRIEFVTPGVALRLLRDEVSASHYAAFLIDEFHERQWEVDLLVAVLRERQKRARAAQQSSPPLVLTSATIAGEQLAQETGATLLRAEGRMFPVETHYLQSPDTPSIRGLEERVVTAIQRSTKGSRKGGDILVFLPGKGEIESCRAACESALSGGKWELLPVHAGVPMKQLNRALTEASSRPRIYLATNVAETSLTLPKVTTVLDSGLVRMNIHRGGRTALALQPVSQSQMDQRAGRAGRVAPGQCIRLWSSTFRPKSDLKPELERTELDDLILQAGASGLAPATLLEAPWISPPPSFALDAAKERLTTLGALDPVDGSLTSLGEEMVHWPVSATEASWLVGAPEALLGTLSDLVALLQSNRSLLLPLPHHKERKEAIIDARRELLVACHDEVMMELTLLHKGHQERHHLHSSGLRQARRIASQLRRLGGMAQTDPTTQTMLPSTDTLAAWLLKRMPALGFVKRKRTEKRQKGGRGPKGPKREPWGNGEMEASLYPFSPSDPDDPHYKAPVAGVLLSLTWVGQRGLSIEARGQMLLPCSIETLADAGLGEQQIASPRVERGKEIVADLTQTLAGVTLRKETRALTGDVLRQAVSDLMGKGHFWSDKMDALLDQLHLIKALSELPPPRHWEPHPMAQTWWKEPEAYIAQRLETLGVESSEDLALCEAEDLFPSFADEMGLDPLTIEEAARDFPRQWGHQGALYHCEIRPASRKVKLTPANNLAKKNEPQARFLPSFRGYRVEYQKASRLIRLR